MNRPRFFTGAYGKFWNALLAGAGVGAGGVLVLALVADRTGAFPGPEPLVIRDAILTLWGAICAALGAALGANIEPGSTIVPPPPQPGVTRTVPAAVVEEEEPVVLRPRPPLE